MQSVALRPCEARRKSPPALRTLVLNADYRPLSTYPLSIIAAQDAVSAIWRERVDVVEAWPDAFFRSPSTTIAVVPLPGRRYRHHVDSHGIRTVQSASCGDPLRSAAACTCQRSLPTLYSMLLLE